MQRQCMAQSSFQKLYPWLLCAAIRFCACKKRNPVGPPEDLGDPDLQSNS
jgi:hypothetical protein